MGSVLNTVYLYPSLTDDSGSSDTDAVNIEDEGGKNSDDDDDDDNDDDDDDGQDSDASGPISSYLGGCFVTWEGEGINSGSLKNDTYLLSEHKHWSEDLDARDSETEGFILDDEVSTEKFQEQSIDSSQSKRCDSKMGICNTTFVIDKSKGCSSMTHPELSHIYKKPVSVVHPITSSVVKQSAKTEDQANSIETSGKLDLVQAVLCSRNKIALALAEIVEGKQPSVTSDDSTCHTDRESEVTSSGEESCSTYARRLESYRCFRETGRGKKEESDLMGKEQTKAFLIRGPNNALACQESKVLDSETRQPLCSNACKLRHFVRRRSLKIASSSLDFKTKSSPHSVKLENGNLNMQRVNSSPSKRRSAILCKFGGPMKCKGQGTYLDWCSEDSPIMSPSSKALGTPSGGQRSATVETCNGQGTYVERCSEDALIMSPSSKALGTPAGHQTTPLVPRSISPALQSSSSNSKRRRSSQVLRVLKDTAPMDSWSSVEKKAKQHKEIRGASFEKGDNLPKTCRSTAKLTSSTSSPDGLARVNYSKRSLFLSNVTPDFASSYQKSNSEDICIEKRESSPSALKNRRDRKLSCSRTYSDLVNAQSRGKFPPSSVALRKNSCDNRSYEGAALNEKNETAEVQTVDELNCGRKLLVSDLVNAQSRGKFPPSSVALRKNSFDNRGYVFGTQDEDAALTEKNEIAEEQTVDELNCGQKLLVSDLLRARADKEQLSAADQAGIQSKERVVKSLKKHAFSPGGSSRNSNLLGGLGSDISPLKSNVRKKRTRVTIDTPESLPSKHAKRGSYCFSNLELCPLQNSSSSQALNCYRKESTPMKKSNLESLRLERFLRQNTRPLSPIKPTPANPGGSGNNAVMSPCKVLGSCDKSFCFDCC